MRLITAWDDETTERFPRLQDNIATDTCVIGLGGSGLACINELIRLGVDVVGIDAGVVGGGAAGRNAGFLLAGMAPFYHDAVSAFGKQRAARIYGLTLGEIGHIAAETPEATRITGSLRIASDDRELDDCLNQWRALRQHGFAAEPYDGVEGPGLHPPQDGVMNPLLRCRRLAAQAKAGGARLFESSPATRIAANFVQTPGGHVSCHIVIVAVDGNLEQLLPELTGRVRTARLQMLATAPAREVRFPRPVYRRWGYDYWQQLSDGRVLLGGMRDHWAESEWAHRAEPTVQVQQGLDHTLRTTLGVASEVTHRWAGVVGYTTSGLPFVGKVRPGVWAIGGYSGTGNVIGSICGRGIARLTARREADLVADFAVAWKQM